MKIESALSLIALLLCIVAYNDEPCRAKSYDSLPNSELFVENASHLLTGGGRDHLTARLISCYVTTPCNLFNISSFHFIFPNLKRSPIEKRHAKQRVTLLYLCVLLLARSSDITLNPGPDSSNFPCGYCHKEVTWSNIMSLMCDNCDEWFHADCQGIWNTTFDILSHSKATWYCHQCNFPNYSTGLFASLDTLSDTSSILNSSYFCSTSQEASNNDDYNQNWSTPSFFIANGS